MRTLPQPRFVYIDSASVTSFTCEVDTWYIVDTATAAVNAYLPAGISEGHWILFTNTPTGGFMVGGTGLGNNLTAFPTGGETIDGGASSVIGAASNATAAGARQFFPVGDAQSSAYGAGWVHV